MYERDTTHTIRHARWTGTKWAYSKVATIKSRSRFGANGEPSLAVDGSGSSHVSYADARGPAFKYAQRTGSGWRREVVEPKDDLGHNSSIAVTPSGAPRIAYYDEGNDALKFAEKSAGRWQTSFIDRKKESGDLGISLAVDGRGDAHVAYQRAIPGKGSVLKYGRENPSGWKTESATSKLTIDDGLEPSLDLDSNGTPHVAFIRDESTLGSKGEDLMYAVKRGRNWHVENLEAPHADALYEDPSIAIDSNGGIHIVAFDNEGNVYRYFWKTGGAWKDRTLIRQSVPGGATTKNVELRVDGGHLFVAYEGLSDYDLKLRAEPIGP